jgi:hypothetical protein
MPTLGMGKIVGEASAVKMALVLRNKIPKAKATKTALSDCCRCMLVFGGAVLVPNFALIAIVYPLLFRGFLLSPAPHGGSQEILSLILNMYSLLCGKARFGNLLV